MVGYDRETAFLRSAGKALQGVRREMFSLRSDSDVAQLALIRAGAGVGMCQVPLGRRDPRLVRLLPRALALKLETWITMHEDLRQQPAVPGGVRCAGTRADELKAADLYPYFTPIQEAFGNKVKVRGQEMIMVGSNNYLGLTDHPKVKEAAKEAIDRYGVGTCGSRFLTGTMDIHEELERRLAALSEEEAALSVSTGYQTNLGIISTIAGKGDDIIVDRMVHASIIDACRLSFATVHKFQHNDMEDLERLLASLDPEAGKLIVVDGVFSMEGDIADLPGIVPLAKKYDARILVDDAHGIGVLGATGRGTSEHFGLESEIDLVMGTFSKSFASIGGFVAGRSRSSPTSSTSPGR